MDSPADLAEPSNPFDAFAFAEQLSKAGNELQDSLTDELKIEEANDADETFYHTLLELVNSESGYSADLKDLVDVSSLNLYPHMVLNTPLCTGANLTKYTLHPSLSLRTGSFLPSLDRTLRYRRTTDHYRSGCYASR